MDRIKERKANRLFGFDYSQSGCYFVTICTFDRQHLFRMEKQAIGNDLYVVPNHMGNAILHKWMHRLQEQFPGVAVDKYVIMPDHIHMIICMEHSGAVSLPRIMQFFKTMTTNEYIQKVKEEKLPPFKKKIWQKSYYDHVIRNQQDYNQTWEYIDNNPLKWMLIHGKIKE